MRLIDADKLKLCYTGTNGLDDKAEYFSIRKMIDLQPTAYDVNKVVEQMEEYVKESSDVDYNRAMIEAIEIVKSGGVE